MKKINKFLINLGNFISKFTNPVIMFFIFIILFIPIGFILKIFNKDILDKNLDKNKKSYWIDRKEEINTMEAQF